MIAELEKFGGGAGVKYDEESPDRPIVGVDLWYSPLVPDAGLEILSGLTGLQQLGLNETQVSDAGLEHLKGLTSLQFLNLNDTQVTDAGLEHLQGLTNLQDLRLHHTQFTLDGVRQLQEVLPKCKISH